MKTNLSYKQIIISSITAQICGLIFVVIIPILALFFVDVLISTAVLFDPLNQGKYIDQVWGAFIGIIITQTIFSILASGTTGIAISFLTENVKTGWVYGIGMLLSLGIYCLFQFISLIFVGFFAGELVVISWALISLSLVGGFSIIIGLICVAVNRKMSPKDRLSL